MNAIDGSSHVEENSRPPPSLLVVILDTNPHAWSLISQTLPLIKAVAALQIFINAHLAFSHDNRVAVIAAHTDRAAWLFPTPKTASSSSSSQPKVPPSQNANKYLPFAAVEREVIANLESLLSSTSPETLAAAQAERNFTTLLAGALTLALSYINKTSLVLSDAASGGAGSIAHGKVATPSPAQGSNSAAPRTLSNSRILVLSTSGDLARQYIPLMNVVFGAQHSRVVVDILKLAGDSVLLQQASFTTGGIFIAPPASTPEGIEAQKQKLKGGAPTPAVLLQYLMRAFLPDPYARQHLLPATSPHVDFRAACFCHQRVVDVGYVCSICLSIFCEDLRKDLGLESWDGPDGKGIECLTCGTRLVLGSTGQKKKKDKEKKKKDKDKDKKSKS